MTEIKYNMTRAELREYIENGIRKDCIEDNLDDLDRIIYESVLVDNGLVFLIDKLFNKDFYISCYTRNNNDVEICLKQNTSTIEENIIFEETNNTVKFFMDILDLIEFETS